MDPTNMLNMNLISSFRTGNVIIDTILSVIIIAIATKFSTYFGTILEYSWNKSHVAENISSVSYTVPHEANRWIDYPIELSSIFYKMQKDKIPFGKIKIVGDVPHGGINYILKTTDEIKIFDDMKLSQLCLEHKNLNKILEVCY